MSESFGSRAALTPDDHRKQQVREALIRLLYGNAHTGIAVTSIAAPVLGYCQWGAVHHPFILGWLLYMGLVSIIRFVLVRRYWRLSPSGTAIGGWSTAFAVGAGMAGAGWGAAGFLLYPDAVVLKQVLL